MQRVGNLLDVVPVERRWRQLGQELVELAGGSGVLAHQEGEHAGVDALAAAVDEEFRVVFLDVDLGGEPDQRREEPRRASLPGPGRFADDHEGAEHQGLFPLVQLGGLLDSDSQVKVEGDDIQIAAQELAALAGEIELGDLAVLEIEDRRLPIVRLVTGAQVADDLFRFSHGGASDRGRLRRVRG